MNSDIRLFLFRLTFLSLTLFFIGWVIFSFFLKRFYLPVFPYTLGLFYITTAVLHIYQISLIKKNFSGFARSNMLSTTLKLIIYSVFTLIYLAFNRDQAIPFVFILFCLYIVFAVFEVIEMTRLNRRLFKKEE
jgi:hypothetical protein